MFVVFAESMCYALTNASLSFPPLLVSNAASVTGAHLPGAQDNSVCLLRAWWLGPQHPHGQAALALHIGQNRLEEV